MEQKFIKSGVPGLDEVLGGGLLEGSVVTLSGPTGSGKSTLAAQFLYNGATKSDEPGLYIAIEETRKEFFFHMSGMNWDLNSLEKDRKFIFLDYPMHEVDQIVNQSNAIAEIIHSTGVKRVVIDSIMPIALFFSGDDERKKGFLKFIENLRKWNVTTIIVSEDLQGSNAGAGQPSSEYGIESFTDGWINIFYRYDDKKMERIRYIEVVKMKGVKHSTKSYLAALDGNGFSLAGSEVAPMKKSVGKEEPAKIRETEPSDEKIDELVEKAFTERPKVLESRFSPSKPAPSPKLMGPPPDTKAQSIKTKSTKSAQTKAANTQGKTRISPAKMSPTIAQRIADAKKRIMKKD